MRSKYIQTVGSRRDAGTKSLHVMDQADDKDTGSGYLPNSLRHLTLHLPSHHQPDTGQCCCLNICQPLQSRKLVTSHEKFYNICDWNYHGNLDTRRIEPLPH